MASCEFCNKPDLEEKLIVVVKGRLFCSAKCFIENDRTKHTKELKSWEFELEADKCFPTYQGSPRNQK